MGLELPVLAGQATINLYAAGSADLNSPVISGLVVNSLQMIPHVEVVTRRVTGASSWKHHALITHHDLAWESVEALGVTQAFRTPPIGRYVMEIAWHPDVLEQGRWKRRLYSGVTLGADSLSSRGSLEINAAMRWQAEDVSESAGGGVMPAIETPLSA